MARPVVAAAKTANTGNELPRAVITQVACFCDVQGLDVGRANGMAIGRSTFSSLVL